MPADTAADGPFPADPEDTRTAIMKATYEALCEYGYAELTVQRIGERFPKSTSLLYHHYDGKDDLLVAFLGYMLERFEERIPSTADADAETRLRAFLDRIVLAPGEARDPAFVKALVELRAQAAHDTAYREQFTRTQERVRAYLADIVADGVESGAFRAVDPDAVAGFLGTLLDGAMLDRATTDATAAATRAELNRYIDGCLLRADDGGNGDGGAGRSS